MIILIYLLLLNSICAIPSESDSVASLEKDRQAQLKSHPSLSHERKELNLDQPLRRSGRIRRISENKKKIADLGVSTRDTKNINADEANPVLKSLLEKKSGTISEIASEIIEKNRKTKTKALENDLQFSEKEENLFNDHTLNSVLDEIVGQGQFIYDLKNLDQKVPESHLLGGASDKLKKTRKRTISKVDQNDALKLLKKEENRIDNGVLKSVSDDNLDQAHFNLDLKSHPVHWEEPGHFSGVAPVNLRNIPANTMSKGGEDNANFVSNDDWDHFLHLSEFDHETNSAVSPNSQHVQWSHLQPAPINRKNQNTQDLRTPLSIDDEVMKGVLDKYKGRGQFKYDWKAWNEKVHSAHPSGIASSKLNKHPRRTVSKDWDHFLQIMEADPVALTLPHPNSQHVLEGRTIVRPVPFNRLNAGNVGKLMSEDSSISVSKAISRGAENILSKLPRHL